VAKFVDIATRQILSINFNMNPKELLSQIAQNLEKIARERDEFKETSEGQKEEILQLKSEISELKSDLKAVKENALAENKIDSPSTNEGIKIWVNLLILIHKLKNLRF